MQNKRYIFCGNLDCGSHTFDQKHDLRLRLHGEDGLDKITLCIEDINERMFRNVSPEFQDLLEIATYVYAADQAIVRKADDVDSFGAGWRRHFHFIIPVRNPDFWNRIEIRESLSTTLGFLSDDAYEFDFDLLQHPQTFQEYLSLIDNGELFGHPQRVALFSGGLDSLAGAIEEVLNQKNKVMLVTHKSTHKLDKRHQALQDMLKKKAGENAPFHVTVRIHKNKKLNREYTQRTRSFLFACIGATVARLLGLSSIYFYENGVISLNLPVCAQVVGGRATRTTHPKAIKGFEQILSLVAGEQFAVKTPFIWKTKAKIVEIITRAGCQEMIAASTTCTHTWEMTKKFTHCGSCSQCIDRRFAVIAAKADSYDPSGAYKTDIFTQSMSKDADKIMIASYLERANQVDEIKDVHDFVSRYSEVVRALPYLDVDINKAVQLAFDLYKRHAEEVMRALDIMHERNVSAIRRRILPEDCLLRTVYESNAVTSIPAVSETSEQPENFFRKRGAAWTFRYQGRNELLLVNVDKGSEYINIMLNRPSELCSVYDIVCSRDVRMCQSALNRGQLDSSEIEEGFQVTTGFPLGDSGAVTDRKSILQYEAEGRRLILEAEEARAAGEMDRVLVLEDEMAQLTEHINSATGKGGKIRKACNARKRVRDAFRRAVQRTIEEIEKYDKLFAEHLKDTLKLGNDVGYLPSQTIEWELRPVVNH